jgi:transposase-like protein
VLESFVTKTRDKAAALKFIKAAMKRYGSPKVIVTDRLRSYGAAMKEIGTADRQETGRHPTTGRKALSEQILLVFRAFVGVRPQLFLLKIFPDAWRVLTRKTRYTQLL